MGSERAEEMFEFVDRGRGAAGVFFDVDLESGDSG